METDLAIHRQLVAQAETNVALARDNLSFAEVMVVDIRERSREADVAASWELLVQAEEDLRHARSVYILSFFLVFANSKFLNNNQVFPFVRACFSIYRIKSFTEVKNLTQTVKPHVVCTRADQLTVAPASINQSRFRFECDTKFKLVFMKN